MSKKLFVVPNICRDGKGYRWLDLLLWIHFFDFKTEFLFLKLKQQAEYCWAREGLKWDVQVASSSPRTQGDFWELVHQRASRPLPAHWPGDADSRGSLQSCWCRSSLWTSSLESHKCCLIMSRQDTAEICSYRWQIHPFVVTRCSNLTWYLRPPLSCEFLKCKQIVLGGTYVTLGIQKAISSPSTPIQRQQLKGNRWAPPTTHGCAVRGSDTLRNTSLAEDMCTHQETVSSGPQEGCFYSMVIHLSLGRCKTICLIQRKRHLNLVWHDFSNN